MIVPGIGGPKEGEASVTAETTPHGPPSHSAIMAAQESNAIPTGPRITQAISKAKVSHGKRPSVMAVIVTRAAVGTSDVSPNSTSDRVLLPGPLLSACDRSALSLAPSPDGAADGVRPR